jgi:hypothetical protein
MASLNDIVNVQIALQTASVQRGDFGTPMIVGPLMSFPERVRIYTELDAAIEDDLPPSILTAVTDCFSQTPRPRQLKVGRRAVSKGVVTITPANLTVYTITVVGTSPETYTFTSDASATAAEIATGLAGVITADTNETMTATAVGDTVELVWISQSNLQGVQLGANLDWGTISPLAGGTAVSDDLAAIKDADNSWYGLVMSERIDATILSAAEWTEANEKLFITASANSDILTPGIETDLVSVLKNTRYYRTAILYHANAATEYPDAAWAGRVFTIAPGAETWALKQLASVTPNNLSATQRNTVITKGGNLFEFYQSQIALTNPGKTAAGEWIDVIRGRDWLKDLIQTNLAQMLINRNKVPYTDAGIQLCATNLRKSLQQAANQGYLAPDEIDSQGVTVPGFVITAPVSADIDPLVKASRILTLEFAARLAGAIHVINVNGSVGYEI